MPQRDASSATTSCAWRLVPTNMMGLPSAARRRRQSSAPRSRPGALPDEILRLAVVLDRLAEVEDVDARALAEDERLHLGIPALGLMSEMHACFEQVLHRE